MCMFRLLIDRGEEKNIYVWLFFVSLMVEIISDKSLPTLHQERMVKLGLISQGWQQTSLFGLLLEHEQGSEAKHIWSTFFAGE